jgi:hypothetical protein
VPRGQRDGFPRPYSRFLDGSYAHSVAKITTRFQCLAFSSGLLMSDGRIVNELEKV